MTATLEIERDVVREKLVVTVWCEHGRGRSSTASGDMLMVPEDLVITLALADHGDRHDCRCLRPLWEKYDGEWRPMVAPTPPLGGN